MPLAFLTSCPTPKTHPRRDPRRLRAEFEAPPSHSAPCGSKCALDYSSRLVSCPAVCTSTHAYVAYHIVVMIVRHMHKKQNHKNNTVRNTQHTKWITRQNTNRYSSTYRQHTSFNFAILGQEPEEHKTTGRHVLILKT